MKSALLVGATGLVGGLCLQMLLEDETYHKIIVLTRKQLNIKNDKLEKYEVDFDKLENYSSLIVADDIFCCLGTTIKKAGSQEAFQKVDFEYPKKIAEIALSNGARQFLIVTALGAKAGSSVFYNRVKGEVELAISELAFQSMYFFRPSLILGNRHETRFGEEIGKTIFKYCSGLMVGRLKRYRAVEAKDIALSMLQKANEDKKGKYIIESEQIWAG